MSQQVGGGTLHAQRVVTYRSSLLPSQAFDVDVWPKVTFVGTDSITSNVSRFYGMQQNVAFQAPDPDTGAVVVWIGQNVIQIGQDGSLSWQMCVYEPSEYATQGLAPTPFFSGRDVVSCDPSQSLALAHFHWDSTGTLSWDIRGLDAEGFPTVPIWAVSYQLPAKYQGPPITCIADIVGYGSGSTTTFSQMSTEICTNAYSTLDGYKDNGILNPNPASVPDLVGYGLPGDSSSPPPQLPIFLTAENSNTNSQIIFQQAGGPVKELKGLPDWMSLI